MSEPATGRRPMTLAERELTLALEKCVYLPGSWDKRFARDMAAQSTVTEKQAAAIARQAWRYRRQLPPEIRPSVEPRPYGAKPARTGC